MKMIKAKGFYSDIGKIDLLNGEAITSITLSDELKITIPFGSSIEVTIWYEENDFLSGVNGIVWGSYDYRQVEIIKNALLAQNILSELETKHSMAGEIHLLIINHKNDIKDSIDFIRKSKSGLCLKPDWAYPFGQPNLSFEQWLGET